MTTDSNTLSLVADVGGTNTRVALAEGARLRTDSVRKFRNADHPSLEDVLSVYVADEGVDCAAAAVAVAGPVRDGKGQLTNLDWSIDKTMLARVTRAERLAVLNDLQAQAHALGHIAPENLRPILAGPEPVAAATRLVVGVGTGFNAAVALETPAGRVVPPCECGHVTMPVRTAEALGLAEFVDDRHGFASVEDVLSGRGLENIYAWRAGRSRDTAAILAAVDDEPAATEAVEWFVRLLGAVAGDLALIHLPFGGLYLIGGMSRAMTPYFDRFGFAESFRDKGRFSDFLGQFPVSLVEDDFAALSGLAAHLADGRI